MDISLFCRRYYFLVGSVGLAVKYIFLYASYKQKDVLLNYTYALTQRIERQVADSSFFAKPKNYIALKCQTQIILYNGN